MKCTLKHIRSNKNTHKYKSKILIVNRPKVEQKWKTPQVIEKKYTTSPCLHTDRQTLAFTDAFIYIMCLRFTDMHEPMELYWCQTNGGKVMLESTRCVYMLVIRCKHCCSKLDLMLVCAYVCKFLRNERSD